MSDPLVQMVDYKKRTLNLVMRNRAAALATTGADGTPHVATVYCLIKPDLAVYFVTRVEARKYHNLSSQPVVAMTFINEKTMNSVQLTGHAERVETLAEEQDALYQLMLLRHNEQIWPLPPVKLYEHHASNELAIIKVTPTELTYADFLTVPTGRYKPFFHRVI